MPARQESCCFTGHRPAKLPWGYNERDPRCVRLKERIADAVLLAYQEGYRHFLCGMAQGCDLYFCEAVLALRERYPEVTVEAAIPCPTQADDWPEAERQRYCQLLAACDYETLVSARYTPDCMQARNKYMVDSSTVLLACFDGRPGGTMNTILYARRQGVQTVIIDI